MVNITLRNIPDEILRRIRIFAAKERRSLNSEMLIVIEEGLTARISETTGDTPNNHHSVLSNAGRKKTWEELCGTWKDTREYSRIRDALYGARGKDANL